MKIEPPRRVPFWLRPGIWIAEKITGKTALPARLLAHFPKGAVGAGVFEVLIAGKGDLDARVLACARIAASVTSGCPFCVDMNAATWKRANLGDDELRSMFEGGLPNGAREGVAVRYARALSSTPVVVDAELERALHDAFSEREIVALAHTIAAVNFWARFNQGLGVPAAGFFDESVCKLPL